MPNEPPPDAAAPLDAEYVAYLDGETPPDVNRQLEELLARDEAARARLHSLEQVWDALDDLPRAHASTVFTSTTVEMIALSVEQETSADQKVAAVDRWRYALVAVAGLAAAVAAGYAIASGTSRRQTEELAGRLPAIERLDEYRQAEDIHFLRRLAAEIEFENPTKVHAKTGD